MKNGEEKTLVLGVCGGVAAYKCAELLRRMRGHGWQVRVIMTRGAQEFISPLTFQALSGHAVYSQAHGQFPDAMDHIHLARQADAVLIAPATAHLMAKLAHGLADDLLTTLSLATEATVFIAPAMNQAMWSHAATQANVASLRKLGYVIIGPDKGQQACGEEGWGRLAELEKIEQILLGRFPGSILQGKRLVVTAGPTYEDIDPVRYIGNRSSGKMGFALAEEARKCGATVTLIAGPTGLATPMGVNRINVRSAQQMFEQVDKAVQEADILISAAAVADYRAAEIKSTKIKKQQDHLQLALVKNVDIISSVAREDGKLFKVGFAAETDHVMEYARDKMRQKGLDMVIANQVGVNKGFEVDFNEVTVIWSGGEIPIAAMSKPLLAKELIKIIAERINEKDTGKNSK